jgi:hypothetical protein
MLFQGLAYIKGDKRFSTKAHGFQQITGTIAVTEADQSVGQVQSNNYLTLHLQLM